MPYYDLPISCSAPLETNCPWQPQPIKRAKLFSPTFSPNVFFTLHYIYKNRIKFVSTFHYIYKK